MNLFLQIQSWLAVLLVMASSLVGQEGELALAQKNQSANPMQPPMMVGYNAPARIAVRGSWDFYAEGSFTYWQPVQENMELCVVQNEAASDIASLVGNIDGDVVNMHFKYKPGFKAGIGVDFEHDDWDSFVQYTWFRGTEHTSSTENPAGNFVIYPLWGQPEEFNAGGTTPSSLVAASEKWTLHMDLLDWELARSFYVGKQLSFRPFFAARAAWIRQNVKVQYTQVGPYLLYTVNQNSHSWGVGPRLGLYSDWMIGKGFRMYGNGAGDILYTNYTKLKDFDTQTSSSGGVSVINNIRQRNLFGLRTHLELELGFGWGSYFANNNWHVDLSAGYTFQIFFDQNMFRKFDNLGLSMQSKSPNGNLYMHGLTANVRFDF